jgi:hypothetical protein
MRIFKTMFLAFCLTFICNSHTFCTDILGSDNIRRLAKTKAFNIDLEEITEQSSINNFSQNIANNLIKLTQNYSANDGFGDEETKTVSTKYWLEKCKILKISALLGNQEAKGIYEKAIESKKYSRDCADCLIAGYEDKYDIKEIRAFFWEHLAYEDEEEKSNLIKAYSEGKIVPFNKKRAEFWKNYSIQSFPSK